MGAVSKVACVQNCAEHEFETSLAAGVTKHLWEIGDMVDVLEACQQLLAR